MTATERINLLGLERGDLRALAGKLGEPSYRGDQIYQWLYQRGLADLEGMTNLSKPFRQRLAEVACVRQPEVIADDTDPDGTRKWLLRVDHHNSIEMVFIPEENRGTLCVSSQVGCTLKCAFCATGQQGYNRNLSPAEIIGQLWLANHLLGVNSKPQERLITNVVFMGMGEPLLNFDNVLSAIRIMLDDLAYGLSKRKVTVSTAGVIPLIDKLHEACPVSLAVSLHAPNDVLRDRLVPLNQKYPISELLAACRRYVADEPRRRITMEYVMLDGVNDSQTQAKELVKLLANIPVKVNLIPFNPFTNSPFRTSTYETIEQFKETLMKAGYITTVRKTRGDGIDAACGQLAGRVVDRTNRSVRMQQKGAA